MAWASVFSLGPATVQLLAGGQSVIFNGPMSIGQSQAITDTVFSRSLMLSITADGGVLLQDQDGGDVPGNDNAYLISVMPSAWPDDTNFQVSSLAVGTGASGAVIATGTDTSITATSLYPYAPDPSSLGAISEQTGILMIVRGLQV